MINQNMKNKTIKIKNSKNIKIQINNYLRKNNLPKRSFKNECQFIYLLLITI